MDTRDFSQATIEEIYDIIEKLKEQGSLWDSIQDYWCISEPGAGELSTYAAKGDLETYYQQHADKMDLTKKKFGKIVENVRAVDYKYQKEFTKCNEELKTFQEKLKNLTEEISLRTVSLDSDSYKHAAEILEGNDEVKKQKLKELIGVKPGESKESRMAQKIQEILKYSIGEGTFEDEIDPESKEASISQKKKLIQEIEKIKEQFRSGKLTQEEVIDQICELYRIEDYGSKINYSLAVKKYQPEKKARIVSDILSTVLYIVEEESLNVEQIEELSQTVKAKSYISDEMWSMAENAFRGAVVGANTAIAGKYYAGVEETKNRNVVEGGSGSKIQEVFDLADDYTLSDDTFNNHILDRHGPNSTYGNKSHFNADFDIREGIDSTLKGDNFVVTPNTAGREGYIFEQTFTDPIGTNSKGKPLYTLKVVIDEAGNVITAFPKK